MSGVIFGGSAAIWLLIALRIFRKSIKSPPNSTEFVESCGALTGYAMGSAFAVAATWSAVRFFA